MEKHMKITDARVVVSSPGRNYVTLVIETEDGIIGVGDASLNGRELSVASYLKDHVCPLLIGRDARRITDTWSYLYKGAYWRRGPVTMTAIAAVDVALWDISGKVAGVPVYQLLGGAAREGVMVYCHASGSTLDELGTNFQTYLDEGYLAIRVQTAVPGLDKTYGIAASDGKVYEPASGNMPQEDTWETSAYLDFTPTMMAHVREQFGYQTHLLHDVHHRLSPIEAGRLGALLEPYRMFWMEDATPAEDQSAFRLIRQHTTTPLAVGEVFNSIWDCQQLITERLIDYIRTSVSHAGGITHLQKIFSLADLYGVRSGSHGAGDLSPIAHAAALHVDLAIPNFGIQEYMGHRAEAAEVFHTAYTFRDGYMHPGDLPGIGVTFDEDAAARYPYDPKYLPINRRLDGSVHDW
jgi:mannonate dehydratase